MQTTKSLIEALITGVDWFTLMVWYAAFDVGIRFWLWIWRLGVS